MFSWLLRQEVGIGYDVRVVEHQLKPLKRKLEELSVEAARVAGTVFSLQSPQVATFRM